MKEFIKERILLLSFSIFLIASFVLANFAYAFYFDEEKKLDSISNTKVLRLQDSNETVVNFESFPTSVATPTPTTKTTSQVTVKKPAAPTVSTKYRFPKVNGWIASFDYTNGKNSFYKNISRFSSINPVYYNLNNDGTASARSVAGDKDLLSRAKKSGVSVIPIIITFSADGLKNMLNDPAKYKAHHDYILGEVDKHGYGGIEIDYESIYLDTKTQYMKMLSDLSTSLHQRGKKLFVDVIAKDGSASYTVLPQTRAAQDWKEIAKYADEVRIMAYDYTSLSNPSNATPGPVSPLDWNEKVIKYALTQIPPEKIILGQALYGYGYDANKRYGLTYADCQILIQRYNLSPKLDEASGEKTFTYPSSTGERKVWYHDVETMDKRFALAKKYGIGGVAFWRLGGEDLNVLGLVSK